MNWKDNWALVLLVIVMTLNGVQGHWENNISIAATTYVATTLYIRRKK